MRAMALDFAIAGHVGDNSCAGIEENLHQRLMATAQKLRLGTLLRLADYYVSRSYDRSEVSALRRDLQQAAASLGKDAAPVFARIDAVLARAEGLRAGIDVVAD